VTLDPIVELLLHCYRPKVAEDTVSWAEFTASIPATFLDHSIVVVIWIMSWPTMNL